ncbi:hypothetical protein B0H13DRAFT_1588477, partial [Mycena leptocephala]
GATDKATSRLYRIVVSESAQLIWRLRNERRIQGKDPASEQEIHMRWKKAINLRLELDCQMTDSCWARRTITKSIILKTWKGTLANEDTLPTDWIREPQVLVGVG